MVSGPRVPARAKPLGQAKELAVLTLIYLLEITTLINKGKPTIAGVSRRGQVLVIVYTGMLVGLYAVAFARILQLTRAVF